jgi:3''-phosphoadenosine 5''-phosphosulfate sulfotransferase (PAPS reductase)/FAD synthetase and related enzymes
MPQPGTAVFWRQGFNLPAAHRRKAFRPGRFPFPLLHIDTGHNYPEVIDFRDSRAAQLGERLIVRSLEDSIKRGSVKLRSPGESRNRHQSVTLLETIGEFGFDACIGGARRDEEKARAKERVFSFRDEFGQWDPKNQRPELWSLYNALSFPGENIRVFPISTGPSWTSGNISSVRSWNCHRSISRTGARLSYATK